ncbi:MAG: NADH-quinone oxidoreductase subunit C [Pseudomonadota bacterium]|jgi:NADH-quinone oxidoreductase subunit C|nr:NADH-quinone oxidoreductase subunit C [Gammaproteobacteria bacterium]MBU1733539.1 NADH-quinone oxidoreductase subunit C [Gammaproteobacteria bacterium]MBU1891745.1 NADH-quinone oxidoreductase subunit C [Gammaproteobacteria bacterium]
MNAFLQGLAGSLQNALAGKSFTLTERLDELTLVVQDVDWASAALILRDHPELRFEQLIDACGMDYSDYGHGQWEGRRFAAVYHLLSVSLNQRVRVRVFAPDDDFPMVDSVTSVWPAANWYERECFDLYGIVFKGHDDLRRILTDYGFIGHPFRKDFPLSGNVEMRYDPDQHRVIYQPVTVEERVLVPRTIREDSYSA